MRVASLCVALAVLAPELSVAQATHADRRSGAPASSYLDRSASYWVARAIANEWDTTTTALRVLAVPATEELTQLLTDSKQSVRRSAAIALGWVGPDAKEAVPALIDRLEADGEDEWVRKSAAQALGQIGPAAHAAVPALIALLGRDDVGDPWNWATDGLAGIGASAVPELREALLSPDGHVSESAAIALGKLGAAARSVEPDLIRLAALADGTPGKILFLNALEDINTPPFDEPPPLKRMAPRSTSPYDVSPDTDGVRRSLARRIVGRWQAQYEGSPGFRNDLFFVDIYANGQYRIWQRSRGTPDGVTGELGTWDMRYLQAAADGSAWPFLCFSSFDARVTKHGCGLVYVDDVYDYTTRLQWRPPAVGGVFIRGVRSAINRPVDD